jgi:hypothetical protein
LVATETRRDERPTSTSRAAPRTEHVWFYEVEEDGYSKDAKRSARPGQQNDLWDALEKFKTWLAHGRTGAQHNEKVLLQPRFRVERWRQALLRDTADQLTPAGEAFAALPDTSIWDGQVWGIHELFPELPADPKAAEAQVRNAASQQLYDLVVKYFAAPTQPIWEQWRTAGTGEKPMNAELAMADWQKAIRVPQQDLNRTAKEVHRLFDAEDGPALPLWKDMVKDAIKAGLSFHETAVKQAPVVQFSQQAPVADLKAALEAIAREVPVSSFPVETIDASVTLHRVMISVLMNFAIFVPDHPAFLVIGGIGAVVFSIAIWLALRSRQRQRSARPALRWKPGPAAVGLGGGIWLAAMMYLLPRVAVVAFASVLLLPYVAEKAGIMDAEKVLAKRGSCTASLGVRPVECVTVRYEEKGLDGKDRVEQLDGVVVMGNAKSLVVLAADGEVRQIPANVIRLSAHPPAPSSR